MINKPGNTSFTPPVRMFNPTNIQTKNLSEQTLEYSDSSSTSKRQEQYIIVPPTELKEEEGAIFKTARRGLKKFNVNVKEELPLIGSYIADLDEKTKGKLVDAGYYVFIDKEKNWLPLKPWEKAMQEINGSGGTDEVSDDEIKKLIERPMLASARFTTDLTKRYTGKGITIAIVDTGIYPHPDFTYPNNRILAFVDFVNGKKVPYDDESHGTHVAGDAAGNGKMSNGLYKGTAPESSIIALKALSKSGSGYTSNIIKAIGWAIKNKDKYNIRVLNLSLGHTANEDYQNDPTDQAVKKAYEAGIVVVAAAGNEGPDPGTVGSPGDSPHVISVGAFDDMNTKDVSDDKMTDFSSRGPTKGGLMKPDIIAPGEIILAPMAPCTEDEISARRYSNLKETMKWFFQMPDEALTRVPSESLKLIGLADSTIDRWHSSPKQARKEINRIFKATQKLPIEYEAYLGMPGTSMSAPTVAGIVAQMLQANPRLTPGQVGIILKITADKLPGNVPTISQGFGMVDPNEAIQMALDAKAGKIGIKEPVIYWPKETPKEVEGEKPG